MPSFASPKDVDAPVRRTTDIGGLSTPVLSQAPPSATNTPRQLAIGAAPPVGTFTATTPAEAALTAPPTEPSIL